MKKDLLGKMYGGWSEIFACAILKRGAIIGIIGKFSTSLKSQDLKFFKYTLYLFTSENFLVCIEKKIIAQYCKLA